MNYFEILSKNKEMTNILLLCESSRNNILPTNRARDLKKKRACKSTVCKTKPKSLVTQYEFNSL